MELIKKVYKTLFWNGLKQSLGELYLSGLSLLVATAAYVGMLIHEIGLETTFQSWVWGSIMTVLIFIMFSNIIKRDVTPALRISYFLMIAGAFVYPDLITISAVIIIIQAITSIIKILREE